MDWLIHSSEIAQFSKDVIDTTTLVRRDGFEAFIVR